MTAKKIEVAAKLLPTFNFGPPPTNREMEKNSGRTNLIEMQKALHTVRQLFF